MSRKNEEYENFDKTMQNLMKVPHDEIKAKLEAERLIKKKTKRSRPPKDSPKGDVNSK